MDSRNVQLVDWMMPPSTRAQSPSFEVYRNDPTTTAPDELRTDLYLPIA